MNRFKSLVNKEEEKKRKQVTIAIVLQGFISLAVEHQVPDQWSHDILQEEFSSQYLSR